MTDLAPELAEMLGSLRGRDPPAPEVLRRLRDMNPRYRVTWTPPTPTRVVKGQVIHGRPPLWWLHEVRPDNKHDHLRRLAGRARLARYYRRSTEDQQTDLGIPLVCEDMIEGYWTVGAFPEHATVVVVNERTGAKRVEPGFGSDRFFADLVESERLYREGLDRLAVEERLDELGDEDALAELTDNPEFRARFRDMVRQHAAEDWAFIFAGKRGVRFEHTLKEGADADTDRESLAGSRHGEDRQPEQRGSGQLQGEGCGSAEVRAGGVGVGA